MFNKLLHIIYYFTIFARKNITHLENNGIIWFLSVRFISLSEQSSEKICYLLVFSCFFSSTYFMSMISMGEINYSISNHIWLFYFIFITSNGE